MELPELIKLVAQAGAPTIVASIALWIIYQLVMSLIPKLMDQWQGTVNEVLSCQKDNTEAVTKLSTYVEQQQDISQQVRDLLIKLNGTARIEVVRPRKGKKGE